MENQTLSTIALSEDEKQHLMTIYGARMRNYLFAYFFMLMTPLFMFRNIFFWMDSPYRIDREDFVEGALALLVTEMPIILSWVYFYYRRMRPYKKDAQSGVKEAVSYTVIDKIYTPYTGQCFLTLSDPKYLHHEVDMETYSLIEIGDNVQLYRGIHSKYVFNRDGKFVFF
jgi:hypothetical protein